MSQQPFQTLRSLVGMTMGARKRAARRWLWPDDNRRDALRMFRDMAAEWKNNYEKYEYGLARKPYRIGQRLRPCPGCSQCLRCLCGNSAACIGLYEAWTKHQKAEPACNDCCGHGCEDGHCDKVSDICDGSGVLPAKKAKVAK
jgi:hypothetical protein